MNSIRWGRLKSAWWRSSRRRWALTTELAGRTAAYMVSEVRPQVGGIIQKRLFTEGGDVAAGQPLYQIDPATYQAAFESARAQPRQGRSQPGEHAQQGRPRYEELVAIKGGQPAGLRRHPGRPQSRARADVAAAQGGGRDGAHQLGLHQGRLADRRGASAARR